MMTCEPACSGGEDDEPLTLFAADFLASPSASPGKGKVRRIAGGYGPRSPQSFARYDPGSCSWRTLQGSLLSEWEPLSETWPRSGMTRSGIVYRRPSSVPPIYGNGSFLWPTPQAHDSHPGRAERVGRHGTKHGGRDLADWVARWPTPTANRWSGLQSHGRNALLGQLNPEWVEWLMGYPIGWSASAG